MTAAAGSGATTAGWSEWQSMLHALPRLADDEARVRSFEQLIRQSSPTLRSQTLRIGAAVLPAETLREYLRRDDDAVLRNAGLEILKLQRRRGFAVATELLADRDPDVVLQAVLVLDHLQDPRALEPLRRVLHHDDVNVQQAAILAIGKVGDEGAVEDLTGFLAGDPWLQAAAIEALGCLRSARAVGPLVGLLGDLMLGSLAAEALARIGGTAAFEALSDHWLEYAEESDAELYAGLLAHVLEGHPPAVEPAGLRARLVQLLAAPAASREARGAAARALLALGPGTGTRRALETLARDGTDPATLPACLRQRPDLVPVLLAGTAVERSWGLLLATRHPAADHREAIRRALGEEMDEATVQAAAACLAAQDDPRLDAALLALYLRLPSEWRPLLDRAIVARREALAALLEGAEGEEPLEPRLALMALVGYPAEPMVESLLAMPDARRAAMLAELAPRPDVLRALPWDEWLARDAAGYADALARAVGFAGLSELLPALRELLRRAPSPALVLAVGAMRDRQSEQILRALYEHHPELRPFVLQSLGEIGSDAARRLLRRAAADGEEAEPRVAFHALARCAVDADLDLFRAAVRHPDWNVRLTAVEVLGRQGTAADSALLTELAADPSTLVAQRALSYLEA